MANAVPSWQTYIGCSGGKLTIRHLKEGLAENLEIPWPKDLRSIVFSKVRLRADEFQPVCLCGKKLDIVQMVDCELEAATLRALEGIQTLRCLELENCNLTDEDFSWLKDCGKLELLKISANPKCTGAILKQLIGAPLRSLKLEGTDLKDSDIPILLSFPQLNYLDVSDTDVTGEALLQLAANPHLNIVCEHDREGLAKFRAAQRQRGKKESELDEKTSGEAWQLVKDFLIASADCKMKRSGYVTQRYLEYCKSHGYNGIDPEQKWFYRSESDQLPYQDCQIVDIEQITKKKYYVYLEKDDEVLSQHRFLVVLTTDGWKIDKGEKYSEGKWKFHSVK